mgnify:CR=1 FL=1
MLEILLYAGVFIIISSMLVMHLSLKKLKKPKLSIVPKCTGSFLFVWLVALAHVQHGANPFQSLLFWFLVICTVADGVIGVNFVAGMLIFGAAHICLIIWSLQQAAFSWIGAVVWAVVMLVMFLLFRGMLQKMGKQALAFVGYAGILVADFAVSLSLAVTAGPAYLLMPVGTLLFLVSDGFIAMELTDKKPWQKYAVMTLYWASLYLISMVPWIIL